MIVKDESSLIQALDLLKIGPVLYSDRYRAISISDVESLSRILQGQLENDDIAIVVLHGREGVMEDYGFSLRVVRRERRIAEQRAVRAWITSHPEEVKKLQKHLVGG